MSGIRPQALSNKELLSAAYIMFEPDVGMPIDYQKEVIRRLALHVQDAHLRATDYGTARERKDDYKRSDPNQLPLFD